MVFSKSMKINFKEENYGLSANGHKLILDEKVWKKYPSKIKRVMIDNYAHLSTINVPVVARIKEIKYNTKEPLFRDYFRRIVLGNIPNSVDDYKKLDTSKLIDEFENKKYYFNGNVEYPDYDRDLKERAIVPFSCGKDSLLTLGVCKEIGLKPVPVYINDTVCPIENELKLKFCKNFNTKIITNEIEKLNDFETYDEDESCLGYSHMTTGFCFIALPYMHFYKADSVVLGNQQDMNFSFINKNGYKAYPSYDQTDEATKIQDYIMKGMTNSQGNVFSVIKPLTNIAITKILWSRYKDLVKYQVSCDCFDAYEEDRWCEQCNKCARLFLFTKAVKGDVKLLGFKKNLFDKKFKKYYSLFGHDFDCYEKSKEARDQQLLAFYMCKDEKGYLIDFFKKNFLNEAKEREEELYKKFFKVYNCDIPYRIKRKVMSLYKEEL